MFNVICNNCGELIPYGAKECNKCSSILPTNKSASSITITSYNKSDISDLIYSISYLTGISDDKIAYGLQATPYIIATNLSKDELNRYMAELSDLNAEFEIYYKPDAPTKEQKTGTKHIICCPNCGSTNVKKISATKRLFSAELFGLASSSIGKQFQCMEKNCGYKW